MLRLPMPKNCSRLNELSLHQNQGASKAECRSSQQSFRLTACRSSHFEGSRRLYVWVGRAVPMKEDQREWMSWRVRGVQTDEEVK